MKTQTKAIIASAVVIVLALSAVAGVTYSWFSDTENFKFDVKTGQIDMKFEGDSVPTVNYLEYPYNMDETTLISKWTDDNSVYSATINTALLKDKDELIIDVPTITINNTIKVNYYEQISIKENDTEVTDSFFKITGLKTAATQYEPTSGSSNVVSAHEITILFDSSGVAQNKVYTISITFTAIQSNAPISVSNGDDLVNTIKACSGNISVNVTKDTSVMESISVSEGKNVTLNIDDNVTLSCEEDILFNVDGGQLTINNGHFDTKRPITITNGGKVTLNGSTIDCSNFIRVGENDGAYVFNDTLTLTDVTIRANNSPCIGTFKGANVTIDHGSFNSTSGCAIATNGNSNNYGQNWKITNAEFNVDVTAYKDALSVAIQCHNGDRWDIEDCTFNVKDGVAISVRGGDVTINNCIYNSTSTPGYMESGQLQYTDNTIIVESGKNVVTYYKDNSYGYNANTRLTIDNESIEIVKDFVRYCD